MDDDVEVEGEESGVPALRPRGPHIKKRALKNKALSVTFNEKDLRDFVSGFHKRKKKRRKEAEKQQEEVLRRKRIEARKKRKLEKEFVLYGGAPPPSDDEPQEDETLLESDDAIEPNESTSGTKVYDTGHMQVTVRTSEISREEEDGPTENALTMPHNRPPVGADKKNNLPVNKTKTFKKVAKQKPRRNSHKKRDKTKGKKKNKKRR